MNNCKRFHLMLNVHRAVTMGKVSVLTMLLSVTLCIALAGAADGELFADEGVAPIDSINLAGGNIVIRDVAYNLSDATQFFTQSGEPISSDFFSDGMLVFYVTDEKGDVVTLREEIDLEGEFTARPANHVKQGDAREEKPPAPGQGRRAKGYHKVDGVWTN